MSHLRFDIGERGGGGCDAAIRSSKLNCFAAVHPQGLLHTGILVYDFDWSLFDVL